MASADVFVFPSLFEGSAVVTYEALAAGLPSVVTPSAGSVVRDGVEGFIVPRGRLMSWLTVWHSSVVILLRLLPAARSALAHWPRTTAGLVLWHSTGPVYRPAVA